MAIAFDSVLNPQNLAGATTTVSFTNTAGNFMLFGVNTNGDGNISSVSYGGNAMTQLGRIDPGGTTGSPLYLFGLKNPPTGSNTISMTPSGSKTGNWPISAVTYSGCDTTTNPEQAANTNSNNGLTSPINGNITPIASGAWAVMVGYANNQSGVIDAGSGSTRRGTMTGAVIFVDTNGTASGSTTLNCNFTTASNHQAASVIASIQPTTLTNSGFFILM